MSHFSRQLLAVVQNVRGVSEVYPAIPTTRRAWQRLVGREGESLVHVLETAGVAQITVNIGVGAGYSASAVAAAVDSAVRDAAPPGARVKVRVSRVSGA
jgi:predicted O-methyltransferase YrrM